MNCLQGFPGPVEHGHIYVCEVDGRLHSVPTSDIILTEKHDISRFTKTIDKHPTIFISRDLLHAAPCRDEINRNVFLPVQEPMFKKLVHIWYEQGIIEALHAAADTETSDNQSTNQVVPKVAQFLLNIVDNLNRFSIYFRPTFSESGTKLIESVSPTNEWSTNCIRCLAWHPHLTKIAVAALDDTIRIYSTESKLVPVLKLRRQRSITCMQWRPMSNSELAVACEQIIIIWTIDPHSMVTRPSSNNAHILTVNNHSPIVSLAWSPFGDLLASAAAYDISIRVWDVDTNRSEVLSRSAGGGKTIVNWSPDGSRLFTASLGIIFRIWDCTNWSAERWDVGEGRVQTACFSPCGTILLFCTTVEPIIFALRSNAEGIWANTVDDGTQSAMPILNLSRSENKTTTFDGGLVRHICWSPRASHLAVLFRESKNVAIFNTITHPVLKITPCCIVNGLEYEIPSTIAFQNNFEHGSCLTIAWSSGRIQYFPLVTTGPIQNFTQGDRVNQSIKNLSFGLL